MTSLYDELGAGPSASHDELHRAYRRRARLLHPDRHSGRPEAALTSAQEAMSRLNHAWSVLGDPESRRRYDWELGRRAGAGLVGPAMDEWASTAAGAPYEDDGDSPVRRRRWFTAGPAVLLAAIMFVIFVLSAYAGPSATPPAAPSAPADNPEVLALLGQCLNIQPGLEAVTDCRQANNGRVLAVPGSNQGCPSGTTPHFLVRQSGMVCLGQDTSGAGAASP